MDNSYATKRLMQERANWRKDHPHLFFARPTTVEGGLNMMKWQCGIPGPKDSPWEGAIYELTMDFPPEYPDKPPKCKFQAGFFHPNVYPSGTVCLSLLDEEKDWKVAITIPQILLGIQDLLNNPNPKSPAQEDAYHVFIQNKEEYKRRVREQAARIAALQQQRQ